jgi:pSer/pThr/pTyr-binding forkhead associated (FHA) protein
MSLEATSETARLVLRRGGSDTDIEFPFTLPAIVGRFDPTVGPIDVDLGALTPEGGYVSRRHARIYLGDDGEARIQDLGSSNGTFVLRDDFVRIEDEAVHDGEEIAFGNARFSFRLGAPTDEEPTLDEEPEIAAEEPV